ncbi:hypothetical protein F5876DRAFT_83845 [Lentinula aff. lateritia]|uniref:Uncharacterized protein n=1 Tax=Lentinula aff. lateritia TaxID=2804960 RepID=A0ACC1THA9_9AGAR|nr:hypothetical protein F5876DRAFT_83845 [Lentinula aff. lateritia]
MPLNRNYSSPSSPPDRPNHDNHHSHRNNGIQSSPPRERERSPNHDHCNCHHSNGCDGDGTRSSPQHQLGSQPSPIRSSACHSSPIVDNHDTEVNDLRRQVLALTNAKKPSEEVQKDQNLHRYNKDALFYDESSQYDAYRRNGFHKPPNDDDDDIDQLEEGPSEEERAEKRNMERGYTAIKKMEHVMPNFIKRVGEEGGQALILEV